MKNLLVLTLCLALTGLARAEQDNDQGKDKGKKQTVTTATAHVEHGKNQPALSNQSNFRVRSKTPLLSNPQLQANPNLNTGKFSKKNWSSQTSTLQSNSQLQGNAFQKNTNKPWKFQKLAIQKNSSISPVHFNSGFKIQGSQNWQGSNYNAFRIYISQRHDRSWWIHNHSRIILVSGGYYYWDNGYWFPAWGYDPNYEFYAYDGPIYGYNGLPPDQVIANVQAVLQRDGYYQGAVDGMLGPLTRAALANYQQDHGLYTTSAIDQPTLRSLGMS